MQLGRSLVFAAIAIATIGQAKAETPVPAVECPSTALSVYFAPGQIAISSQAQPLVVKVRDTIAHCRPDIISLTARVDRDLEGPDAEAHANLRLATLASELVAAGLPLDRILLSTLEGRPTVSADNRLQSVEIEFGKMGSERPEAAPAKPDARPSRDRESRKSI